jgi:hypothetical protein
MPCRKEIIMTNSQMRVAFAISAPLRFPPPARPEPRNAPYPCPRCGKLLGLRDTTLEVLFHVDLHECTNPNHKEL